MATMTNVADIGTRLTLLPRSAAGPDEEIERRGETIQRDAYRIDVDVTIRGGRPGGELRDRRRRVAHTVSNEPNEVHVVPWSPYLVAGRASGSGTPSCAKTRPSWHRRKNRASRNQAQTLARERVTRQPPTFDCRSTHRWRRRVDRREAATDP